MTVILNNREIDFDVAVNLMDDDIREDIHFSGDFETDQEFLDAYCAAHLAKYGEEFVVN